MSCICIDLLQKPSNGTNIFLQGPGAKIQVSTKESKKLYRLAFPQSFELNIFFLKNFETDLNYYAKWCTYIMYPTFFLKLGFWGLDS